MLCRAATHWHVALCPDICAVPLLLPLLLLQSGFYDNNKGLDYHVQVKGGTGSMPALRVVHVAAEMAPIAKASWQSAVLAVC